MRRNEKGITLIALVVTIVVLLILAGVSISLVLGNNGLISKAKDAVNKYAESAVNDQADINSVTDWIDKQVGNSGDGGTGNPPTELPSTTETKPYLPTDDFSQVPDTDLSNGLVIEDKVGNQYVWIEVPKSVTASATTDKEIETALKNYTTDYKSSTYSDVWYDGNSKTQANGGNVNDTSGCGLTYAQYNELYSKMLNSIKNNGGFWIGRYEAGIATNRTDKTEPINGIIPLSKVNQYPLTYVTCSQAQTIAGRVLGIDITKEHVSSLMFGVQWDLVLKFLETKGVTQSELKSDSKNWGNYVNSTITLHQGKYAKYSNFTLNTTWNDYNVDEPGYIVGENKVAQTTNGYGILMTTGTSNNTNKMNVYDLAGNVDEWTLEYTSYTVIPCSIRGGSCSFFGSGGPASYRGGVSMSSDNNIGFRLSLY